LHDRGDYLVDHCDTPNIRAGFLRTRLHLVRRPLVRSNVFCISCLASIQSVRWQQISIVIEPRALDSSCSVSSSQRLREDREKDRQKSEMEYRASEALKGISEQAEFVTRSADWDLTGDEALAAGDGAGAIKRPRLDDDGNLLPSDGLYRGCSEIPFSASLARYSISLF
jgi:hypothetical protein